MARSRSSSHVPVKPILYALLSLVLGVGLLILSQVVAPADEPVADEPTTAPATAPAGETDTGADGDAPTERQKDAAAENLSGLLLLFSAAGFLMCVVCIGWLVVLIRKARPKWKTQTKYPRMR